MIDCPVMVTEVVLPGYIGLYRAEVLTFTKRSSLAVPQGEAEALVGQVMLVPGAVEHWQISIDEVTVRLVRSGASCCAASSIPASSAAVAEF